MFAGHAAVALAAKPLLPHRSLGVLFAATYLIDLIWPVFLLLGWERVEIEPGNTAFTPLAFVHYPWTHALLTAAGWGILFAVIATRGSLKPARDFFLLAGVVVSHWLLDLVSHRPDLPLVPGTSLLFGLGLWNSVAASIVVEGGLFAAGITLYLRATKTRDRTGVLALWTLLILIGGIWISGPFSPPPPSSQAIAVVGLLTWLLPVWAFWADRHREVKPRTGDPR